MRFSCILCNLLTAALALLYGVRALTGFDALLFLCLGSALASRCFTAVCAVAALFNVYALLVFRPYRGLK